MGVRRILGFLVRRSYNASPLPLLSSLIQDNPHFSRSLSNVSTDERDEVKSIYPGNDLIQTELNQQEARICRSRIKIISTIGLIFATIIAYLTVFGTFQGSDAPNCRPIYMYPSYAKLDGFDLNFTPLAEKYHMYLYREQGLDIEPMGDNSIQLDGVPVLFIPGNAGSFKQVRSIAAICSELYYANEEELKNPNGRNLDFFAADFNEDFTAFHGRTMLDQAEYLNDAIKYILSLYEQSHSYKGPLPKSVIVVGHSMGGVVARILPMLQNHIQASIRSIVTLSSPHAASPVTFDGDILKIYQQTNDFWRSQFEDSNSFVSQNVSLISITGGILDSTLPADYTAIEDVVPPKNGLTAFTTGIPDVWTPIDHLAIVWCDQLRQVVGRFLLETVFANSSEKVVPLNQRMAIARRYFTSGLEDNAFADFHLADPHDYFEDFMPKDFQDSEVKKTGERLTVSPGNTDVSSKYTKFLLPKSDPTAVFYFLTSMPVTFIRFCKGDASVDDERDTFLECVDAGPDLLHIPASSKDTKYPADSAIEGNLEPFKLLKLNNRDLSQYDFVLLKNPNMVDITNDDFMIAGIIPGINETVSHVTPFHIALRGHEIKLNSQSPLYELSFPHLWESLIAYDLDVGVDYDKKEDQLFQPFIRQWNHDPGETKWHVNVTHSTTNIFMHNVAPFIPVEETHDKALKLTVFQPPEAHLRLRIKINLRMTLQMLFLRYRLSFLALPIGIVSIVMAYQFYWYNKTSRFMNFEDSLSLILYRYWILISVILISLSPLVNWKSVQRLLFALDPIGFNRPFLLDKIHLHTNFYFLGIRSKYMLGLGLFFTIMIIGVLILIFRLSQFLDSIICRLKKNQHVSSPRIRPSRRKSQLLGLARLLSSLVLILAVGIYIPYQLATAICLVIQIGTCIRITVLSENNKNKEYLNLKNYNFSVFLLLALIVAVDSPIVIVFLHNVAIGWETPFNSHHNIMAVAPIIILVGVNSRLNIPNYTKFDNIILIGLLSYMGFFSLIYGTRNLYWTHHLSNIISAWLLYGMNSTGQQT